ncbi:hypothetical protein [uncultured Bacteroides sp.]|uniref:hypothetical protein n=1 Tax=uncultured Bacteroides sp. TaxID=162156 RepID=UPI002AA93907|nr:hypothetical protein [uncultured Bacteroides sp.]
METNKKTNSALRQALDSRHKSGLPSNFTFRMMEQVHIEAQRQRKRRALISSISLISASLLLVGLAVYALVFRMNIKWSDLMPHVNASSSMIEFYVYIAVLVLALLGLDHLLRALGRKRGL